MINLFLKGCPQQAFRYILNERDRQLTPLPLIGYNSLTQKEINVFDNSWCISDRVEVGGDTFQGSGLRRRVGNAQKRT